MSKYHISITKTYTVVKSEEVELEFDNADEAEDWFYSNGFYNYIEDLKFEDEEWEQIEIEANII